MPDSNSNRTGPPSDPAPTDLHKEREHLLQSFSRGARLTEEVATEHERLVSLVAELERDNAVLRAKVEADDAVVSCSPRSSVWRMKDKNSCLTFAK